MTINELDEIGRIPYSGDNAAIAICDLPKGSRFKWQDGQYALSHDILEGHRFAIAAIARGEALLSWGLPFGLALRDIRPGEYLCNAGILDALRLRKPQQALPEVANFKDEIREYRLDADNFKAGESLPLYPQSAVFQGYARPGARGAGTRNMLVILATSALTASYANSLAARMQAHCREFDNIDGIVPVTHTEGAGNMQPNNLQHLLHTLAGFMVHANVAAVLAVDYGTEALTNSMLADFMHEHDYPLDHVPHQFYTIDKDFQTALDEGEMILKGWLPQAQAHSRQDIPLSKLRIALQCGGSDAFSGISGNPLAAAVAKELIRHGGSAVLAETDELIGAEAYVLANTRDVATAQRFLDKIALFKQRVGWHGHSAEGNPSAGNKFRGLYNIVIKSIGAARKKDAEVRLDHVIDYAQPMRQAGFYFMDSPGNDLESIAGQVAAGCNMIFFITGNGSITNFPFVPTIKFVTTTARWNLLAEDMDINAGRYLDGVAMDRLCDEAFAQMLSVASGTLSAGERAGHSQVSIWRDWQQSDARQLSALRMRARPDARPLSVPANDSSTAALSTALKDYSFNGEKIALIVPTSLCSGQIARMIAGDLNARGINGEKPLLRFVALVHSEGCGVSSGENEDHYLRTMSGHLQHPTVRAALLLEHGCERTHNDLIRTILGEHGLAPDSFGYASVQLDGGIDKVRHKVEHWFSEKLSETSRRTDEDSTDTALSLGLLTFLPVADSLASALALLVRAIVNAGGSVILAENSSLLQSSAFLSALAWSRAPAPTLDYGQFNRSPGLHIMAMPTLNQVETLTGLGGSGAQLLLACIADHPLQAHPMIPVLQITTAASAAAAYNSDLDCIIDSAGQSPEHIALTVLQLLCRTATQEHVPGLQHSGSSNFQLTRGSLGVSL